jgi:hypothetical protein
MPSTYTPPRMVPEMSEDEVRPIARKMIKAGMLTDCFKHGDGTGWYIGFPNGHAEHTASFGLVEGVASIGKHLL